MLTITLRDLQYRKRQFAIAVVGTALTFALALLLTGVRSGFDTEARDMVDAVGADGWVVAKGSEGPFTAVTGLPPTAVVRVRAVKGVEQAQPFLAAPNTAKDESGNLHGINLVGIVPGKLGAPTVDEGEPLARNGNGTVVASSRLGEGVGESLEIAGHEFRIVGIVNDRSYFGGAGVIYMTISDARELIFGGRPLSNAVIFTGDLTRVPEGLRERSNTQIEADMKRVLKGAIRTIDVVRILMWIVAAVIIGAVIYLSALERLTDFAVLKAIGGESRGLALGVSLEAVVASLLSAALAVALSFPLRPTVPLPTTIGAAAYASLVVIAVVVGVLASLAALRRVLRIDPALAFG